MNSVILSGRITRDPEVKQTQSQMSVARFNIAIDRGKDKNGESRGADFPSILAFGKTAELVGRYGFKGQLVAVQGRIQTGSYDKDGSKVYTTDVVADRVEFLEWRSKEENDAPEGFSKLEESIPF